jgi:YD repeat-containing protein
LVTAVDAQNKILRKRQATYFADGSINTLNDVVNGGHDPATGNPYVNQVTPNWVFAYLADGNLGTTTDPTGFVLTYSYDPTTFSYITGTTDSFGYTSTAVPDPALGVFTSITDSNGFSAQFGYDRVTPRLFEVDAPNAAGVGGTHQVIAVQYSDLTPGERTLPAYAMVRHEDVLNVGDPLETMTFIDGLGRTIQTKKSRERSQVSGRRVERQTGDSHVATDFAEAPNETQAFKDEARRIEQTGGPASQQNYNRIESPGKKLLEGEK